MALNLSGMSLGELERKREELSEAAKAARGDRAINLNATIRAIDQERERRIVAAADDPLATGASYLRNPHAPERGQHVADAIASNETRAQQRDNAARCLDELVRTDTLTGPAAERLQDVFDRDASGWDALYARAAADPHYLGYFTKVAQHGPAAVLEMTPEEQRAGRTMQQVRRGRDMASGVRDFSSSLQIGDGSSGAGLAAPVSLDATILNVSDGAINPLRRVCTVRTVATSELRLISSEGVTAHRRTESGEADDDTPPWPSRWSGPPAWTCSSPCPTRRSTTGAACRATSRN